MPTAVPSMMPRRVALRRALANPVSMDVGAVVVAMLVIGGPALFTRNGFMSDFTNHLWLVGVQEHAISAHLLPTYFINTTVNGVFYPVFLFYGATLYAVTGAIAALFGGADGAAYVGVILASVAAAYGGLLWLARQLGVRSWMAHAPAIAYVTSAYYVTNLYGRGAWPEFVATSMLPLVFASGWRLATQERLTIFPASLFVLSCIAFSGSHNITLLLGSLFLLLLLAGLGVGAGRDLAVPPRRLLALAGLALAAVLVNAWFLVPDLLHAKSTSVAQMHYRWRDTRMFNTPGVIFDPVPSVPKGSTTPALFVQAPDWFLAWALIAGALLWPKCGRRLRRTGLAILGLLSLILALMMIGPLWDAMPTILKDVQFPYRLDTYVALSVAALVLVGVLALGRLEPGRRSTALLGALEAAIVVSAGLCVWQIMVPNTATPLTYANRNAVFASLHKPPRTWYDVNSYADLSQPVVATAPAPLIIDPARVNGDSVTLKIDPPAGRAPFAANFVAGPYAVNVGGGIERAGRTKDGLVAMRRIKGGGGPVTLTLSRAGGALTTGRVLSLLALASLLASLVFAVGRRLRGR